MVSVLPLRISEAAFQRIVIHRAVSRGWMWAHVPVTQRGTKHFTAVEGNPGLPDLILARGGVVLMLELKAQQGRATPGQKLWVSAAGGYVVRPSDWEFVWNLLE